MARAKGVWTYAIEPPDGGDARKIVTLEQDEMRWVRIRAFHHAERRWYNGNEPERGTIIAWRDLDQPAKGSWLRGKLICADDSVFAEDATCSFSVSLPWRGTVAEKRLPLRIGGVMRCCIATLSEYEGIDGEGVEMGEGTVLPCKYCSSSLIVRDGKWEWNRTESGSPDVSSGWTP